MAIEGVANTEYASLTGKIRTFVVDKTLTISGACADAKATGEAIDSALDGALFEAKAVRKTGDTMTGDLTFNGQTTPRIIMQKPSSEDEGVIYPGKNNMCITTRNKQGDDTNRRALYIYNGTNATIDKALRLLEVVDGVEKWYDLIHTGNLGVGNSARVVLGSYTGGGKYGANNPCTLTFGFRPKIVIINKSFAVPNFSEGDRGAGKGFAVLYGNGDSFAAYMYNAETRYINELFDVTTTNTGISWYYKSGMISHDDYQDNMAASQLDDSGISYTYVAIG